MEMSRSNFSYYKAVAKLLAAAGPPTYVAAALNSFPSSTTSPTANYPTVDENDIMFCCFVTRSTHSASGTPPTGWTKMAEVNFSAGEISMFWKRAGASEPASEAWTNIFSSGEQGSVWTLAWRGATQSGAPYEALVTETSASGTAKDIASTSLTANTRGIAFFAIDPSGTGRNMTFDAGVEIVQDRFTTPSGTVSDDEGLYVGQKPLETAGAYSIGGDLSHAESCGEITFALIPE
jgi:hypothetical protein